MNDPMNDHQSQGLYDPAFEHDNCGIGAVIDLKGIKTAANVDSALKIVETLEHRAGKDADGKTGDGVGILLQISHSYFSSLYNLPGERKYGIGMFFMVSGALLLPIKISTKQFLHRRLKKIVGPILFWTFFKSDD